MLHIVGIVALILLGAVGAAALLFLALRSFLRFLFKPFRDWSGN